MDKLASNYIFRVVPWPLSVWFRVFHFPHFPRKFSASLISTGTNTLLWTALSMLFLINFYAKLNITPSYWKPLVMVLQAPFTATNHEILAYNFWKEGWISQAHIELKLAQELPKTNQASVLGVSTEDELTAWDLEPMRAKKAYEYWKNIVATKSGYRDGYVALSHAAYTLGKMTEANFFARQALQLDPDNVTAVQLLNFSKLAF